MSCCTQPSVVPKLTGQLSNGIVSISAVETLVLVDGSYEKISTESVNVFTYTFIADPSTAPLWVLQINAGADVSLPGNWTLISGQKTFAEFEAELLPALSGTGFNFTIDISLQTAFAMYANILLKAEVDGENACGSFLLPITLGPTPTIELGIITDTGFQGATEAQLTSLQNGTYQFAYQTSISGQELVPNNSTFFEIAIYVGGNIYSNIFAAWGTDMLNPTSTTVVNPSDLNPGEAMDPMMKWIGALPQPINGFIPLQYLFSGDFVLDDFNNSSAEFNKFDFAQIFGFEGVNAVEVELHMRISHNGVYSGWDTILFPILDIPGRLESPSYMAVESQTDSVAITSQGSGTVRLSPGKDLITTFGFPQTGNPRPQGVAFDDAVIDQGKDSVLYSISIDSQGGLYSHNSIPNTYEDGVQVPGITMASFLSSYGKLERLQIKFNGETAFIASLPYRTNVLFKDDTGGWQVADPASNDLTSIIGRTCAIDPNTGDVYVMGRDSQAVELIRVVIGSVPSVDFGNEPTFTTSVVARFAIGDEDGLGNGTEGLGDATGKVGGVIGQVGYPEINIEHGPIVGGAISFYLTDTPSNKLKHITLEPGKTLLDEDAFRVDTIAGNGNAGVPTDGVVSTTGAFFDGPFDIVAMPDDTYLISNYNGHFISKWNPSDNTIITWLGNGQPGANDSRRI